MPDVPGSGPTDPEDVLLAIHAGATLHDGRLRLPRGGDRWLAATLTNAGPRWVLTTTRGVELGGATYEQLAKGRLAPGGVVVVDRATFALVPPDPDAAEQVALLMPG